VGVKLSEYHINSLIKTLNSMSKTIGFKQYDIVNELVEKGAKKATALNNKAAKSGLEESVVIPIKAQRYWEGNVVRGKVRLKGPHAIFEEFGTGEVGKSDPHPKAGVMSFSVPPYSGYITGDFVRTHINKYGRHYWFYSPMGGKHTRKNGYIHSNGYTEGIPSGKQMYNTGKYLNSIKGKVVSKHLKGAIKEINKAINTFE
jgi:hypothetical protein